MGWSGGADVCIGVWDAVRKYVPAKKRAKVLADVIMVLEQQDWDCQYEIGESWPEAYEALKLCGHTSEEDDDDA